MRLLDIGSHTTSRQYPGSSRRPNAFRAAAMTMQETLTTNSVSLRWDCTLYLRFSSHLSFTYTGIHAGSKAVRSHRKLTPC